MAVTRDTRMVIAVDDLDAHFAHWEKIKDITDQLVDLMLNYRQSGHPGGSRSKVHVLHSTLLSGVMRWDIRHPEKRFADRFILVGGHTVPLIYATLAVFNEALRIKFEQTGDRRYEVPNAEERALYWQDLLGFRRRGGLSGHAEMEGKTLFLKFNTGPTGHGSPAAVGEALALKRAGAGEVRVFAFEGEGGLTAGGSHESLNSAWGLALDNLYFVVDWNDFGIDEHPVSSAVYGSPADWFGSRGWRVFGTEQGNDWRSVTTTLLEMVSSENPERAPQRHLGSHPQRPRLPQVRLRLSWRPAQDGLRDLLGDEARVRRALRLPVPQLLWRGARRPRRGQGRVPLQRGGGH